MHQFLWVYAINTSFYWINVSMSVMGILAAKFFVLEKLEDKWVDNHFYFFIELLEN